MTGFSPRPGGGYTVAFERHEASLISELAGQIAQLLSPLASAPGGELGARPPLSEQDLLDSLEASGSLALHEDPAIARLLPDAYGDEADADSASDFRRYTEQGIVDRKVANALVIVNSLAASIDVNMTENLAMPMEFTEAQAQSWLRGLTDIRLTIASRIGIETEEDVQGSNNDTAPFLREVYHWLGYLTESLLSAIDREHDEHPY